MTTSRTNEVDERPTTDTNPTDVSGLSERVQIAAAGELLRQAVELLTDVAATLLRIADGHGR